MFSSTNNLHLFPLQQYFPSSSSSYHHHLVPPPPPSPPPPPHHEPNPSDVVFIPQDPLSLQGSGGPFLGVVPEEAARMKNEQQEVVMSQNHGQCFSSGLNNFLTKKTTVKKDRHSKIYTAQGLRDRRVRLSIEISRKFFDLQDMLGYDKASKTLDWLLTKSRKAIKELTKTRHSSSKYNNSSSNNNNNLYNLDSECEVISNDEAEKIMLAKSSKKNVAFHDVVAKESRAKARARARERTKEKIMSKSQQAIPEILNHQFRSPPPPLPPTSSSSSSMPIVQKATTTATAAAIGANSSDQENNIIGIMWKPSPMITTSGYQKNLVISKGDAYYNNCNNFYFPSTLPPNWDINIDSFARAQSGFCSIANMDSLPEHGSFLSCNLQNFKCVQSHGMPAATTNTCTNSYISMVVCGFNPTLYIQHECFEISLELAVKAFAATKMDDFVLFWFLGKCLDFII